MRSGSIFWKLFFGTATLIVVTLVCSAWWIIRMVDRFHSAELTTYLQSQAALVRSVTQDDFSADRAAQLDRLAKKIGSEQKGALRITVIGSDGAVWADSMESPAVMQLHDDRPEVIQALAEGWGEHVRYSSTVLRDMKYVALRIGPTDDPQGIIRTSMPVRKITARQDAIRGLIWRTTCLGVLASLLFCLGLARLWSLPIRRVTAMARTASLGDLSRRFQLEGSDEVAALARALDDMRQRIAGQMGLLAAERHLLKSLLNQLDEGVVVVGPDSRVRLLNPAAERFLEIPAGVAPVSDASPGPVVEQCITRHVFQQMLLKADPGGESTSAGTPRPPMSPARIRVESRVDQRALTFLVRTTDIYLPKPGGEMSDDADESVRELGRLMVLVDITELDRVSEIKTDFVVNASHDLRTPIAVIRAAAETLLNMQAAEWGSHGPKFLGMIQQRAEQMERMVSRLLDLSRIEASTGPFDRQPVTLPTFLDDLLVESHDRLEERRLQWSVDVDSDVHVIQVSPYLLRLVLENLVDNAIEFSHPLGLVSITCASLDEESADGRRQLVSITVADNGCGIDQDEQTRVFERFYQVDKTGSSRNRGAGLGLSIVRHAASAMGGTVSLESVTGKGTRVTLVFPANSA